MSRWLFVQRWAHGSPLSVSLDGSPLSILRIFMIVHGSVINKSWHWRRNLAFQTAFQAISQHAPPPILLRVLYRRWVLVDIATSNQQLDYRIPLPKHVLLHRTHILSVNPPGWYKCRVCCPQQIWYIPSNPTVDSRGCRWHKTRSISLRVWRPLENVALSPLNLPRTQHGLGWDIFSRRKIPVDALYLTLSSNETSSSYAPWTSPMKINRRFPRSWDFDGFSRSGRKAIWTIPVTYLALSTTSFGGGFATLNWSR